MAANFKKVFTVDDRQIMHLNVIKKKHVLALWQQIRADRPLNIWIGLVSDTMLGRKVRKPAWFFVDRENMCYVYLPFSKEIRLLGYYHLQYPPILWIYNHDYYCGEIDGEPTYVSLIAFANIMLTY